MKLFKNYGVFLFWVVLLLDCFLIDLGATQERYFTKLALMPILAIYFLACTKKSKHYSKKVLVYLSLFAALIGDYFLLKSGENYFLLGMLFFSICYGIYAVLFKYMNPVKASEIQEPFLAFIAMLILSAVLYKFLKIRDIPQLNVYIIFYMVLLSIMTALAVNVFKDKTKKAFALSHLIPGATIIVLSDSLLAVHKFYLTDISFLAVVVMLTYGFGQVLIVQGLIKYLKA